MAVARVTRQGPARRRKPRPLTVAHFKDWAGELILDGWAEHMADGKVRWHEPRPWDVEPFQVDVVRDILAGHPEVWIVVPEGNGKTTLIAGVGLYHAEHVPDPFVPIGASSREQAEILYGQAAGFVERTPRLREVFRCYDGYRRITRRDGVPGRIQVFAADDRTADGVIPTLALVDELHRHRDLKLYRTWRGKIEKRGGQIVAISTAGEPASEFEDTRAAIIRSATSKRVRGAHLRAEAPGGVILHDWAVRDRSKVGDMAAVAAANPRKDITAHVLERKRQTPTMTPEHWARFVCNIATREHGQAVAPEVWDRGCEPDVEPDVSKWAVGWVDLGWAVDCSAVGALVWESHERRVVHVEAILEAPVDEDDVANAILNVWTTFRPEVVVYDPNAGGQQMAQLLAKGTHPAQVEREIGPVEFADHPQDNARMSLAAARLDEALRGGWIVHDGDAELRRHVLNAVKKPTGGERWKYDRPPDAQGRRRAKFPIDALTGLVMGHSVAVAENEHERRPLVAVIGSR